MNRDQRLVVAGAAMLLALVLFAVYFGKPAWDWATWNAKQGTLDLGFVKLTNRPPFPGGARGIGLGLVVPIVLAAVGRVLMLGGPRAGDAR